MCDSRGNLKVRRKDCLSLLLTVCVSLWAGIAEKASAEEVHPLIRGVRVERLVPPHDSDTEVLEKVSAWMEHETPSVKDATLAIGQDLLNHFGCVTCHDLPVAPFAERRGPDLDRIGEKTSSAWLRRWLEDPFAVAPTTRMPRVPLTFQEREQIVAFLMVQRRTGSGSPADGDGDPERGRAFYQEAGCPSCHRLGGEGGARGPALDGVKEKLQRAWLTAYLRRPREALGNAAMPEYDLTAFLLGPGQGGRTDWEETAPDLVIQAGLSAYAQRGCARCHRIGVYRKPLSPEARGLAEAQKVLKHHEADRPNSPRIALTSGQRGAMSEALAFIRASSLSAMPGGAGDVDAFLETYWQTPIPPQGRAPAAFDSTVADLRPEACGTCHVEQWRDWQTTVHSQSMGAGVMGQLLDRIEQEPGFVSGCQECHAPLSEQHRVTPEGDGHRLNPTYRADLQSAGLTCAACHVRGHRRFGPPPGPRPSAQVWGVGHGGAVATAAFEQSAFCRGCHQFPEDGVRLNDKLLENTYNEWLGSPQARQGQTCQTCHMPDRRHLWRGIHDPEMTRQAVRVEVVPRGYGEDDSLRAEVRVENAGAGHHLPTYVTPAIYVTVRLLDRMMGVLPGTEEVRVVQRRVVLTTEESWELFDTRIPAGGRWVFDYATFSHADAALLEVTLDVHPDDFYQGFFEGYDRDGISEAARSMIDTAWGRTALTPYRLMARRWPLSALAPGQGGQ